MIMLKDLRVLIVDDDPGVLDTLGDYIRGLGHQVTGRRNVQEALEALRDDEFCLVITDAQMEGMDGLELARRVRANYPGIAILMMTAHESMYPMSAALRAGADGYISKPFSLRKFALIFERSYWEALSRLDWWYARGGDAQVAETVR
jgi:two-component system OmpR family response regulator